MLLGIHFSDGHLESLQLWEQQINAILKTLKAKNTTHEHNIYTANINGRKVLFLHQVDKFAVACPDKTICHKVITEIGKHLTVPLHLFGRRTKFKGVNVLKTQHFIKISCKSHIDKVLNHHGWQESHTQHYPIPIKDNGKYQIQLETRTPPTPEEASKGLQNKHFNYQQVTGKAIYTMVTCYPGTSNAVLELSQYLMNPAASTTKPFDTYFGIWQGYPLLAKPTSQLPF